MSDSDGVLSIDNVSTSRRQPPLMSVENLSFDYGDGVPVLQDLDLQVETGSVVGIVGPSGCGKSTLLALIAGLRRQTTGRIVWNRPSEDDRHPLSMMFQTDTLLPWLNVRKNVGIHYRYLGRAPRNVRAERNARIDRLIDVVGLGDATHKYPYQLSGGMRRRTAFAAAAVSEPHTLLLDEPFSSLDEPTRIAIHQDVHGVLKRGRTTTLLITHDLAEALSLSDAVFVMSARPSKVYKRFEVPFGTDREMLSLREQPEFLALYGEVWEQLATQIQRSKQQPTAGGTK